jgi:hypothetical protein
MSYLKRSDLRFLASVGSDRVRKIDDLIDAADELLDAADVAGVAADLSTLDQLDDDELVDELIDDPELLDAIRGDLRAQLGRIGRGEHLSPDTTPTEETTEDVQPGR